MLRSLQGISITCLKLFFNRINDEKGRTMRQSRTLFFLSSQMIRNGKKTNHEWNAVLVLQANVKSRFSVELRRNISPKNFPSEDTFLTEIVNFLPLKEIK